MNKVVSSVCWRCGYGVTSSSSDAVIASRHSEELAVLGLDVDSKGFA